MVDYTMTAFGMTLAQALMPLCEWVAVHRDKIAEIMVSRSSTFESTSNLANCKRTASAP